MIRRKRFYIVVIALAITLNLIQVPKAFAQTFESRMVEASKEWTIEFNTPIDPDSISVESIYITNSSEQKLDSITLYPISNNKKIRVINQKPYNSGASYELHVASNLEGLNGKHLKNHVNIPFSIK